MKQPAIPEGRRIYAIGDVHGRLDLLEHLLAKIRKDSAERGPAVTKIILLGDLIDRGPQSAQIVHRLQAYTRASDRIVVLRGNHEEMMIWALSGDLETLAAWLRFGGDQTLRSWGVPEAALSAPLAQLVAVANRCVSREDKTWLRSRPLSHREGDYLFVHAGVRPGTPLDDQDPQDLMWIGKDFTESVEAHGAVIVHGHSIEEEGPVFRHNRIGLDTGAYRSGRLTGLGLEASEAWTLTTELDEMSSPLEPVMASA